MADDEADTFLTEGIARYAEALLTIEAFETVLQERLIDFVLNYAGALLTLERSHTSTGATEGSWGQAIWIYTECKLAGRTQPAWMELGLWWRKSEIAAYSGFVDEANKGIGLSYAGIDPRIEPNKWSGKQRLFLVLRPPLTLQTVHDALQLVADQLCAAYARQRTDA